MNHNLNKFMPEAKRYFPSEYLMLIDSALSLAYTTGKIDGLKHNQ